MRRIEEWPSVRAERPSGAGGEAASGDRHFRPPRRVLHVERDTFLAALVHATLEDAGFDVHWYPSADAALGTAPEAAYDVYLLEGDLPGVSGRTTAGTVADLARGGPIVILADELEAGIDAARVSMLLKPFPPRALVEAVESAAQQAPRGMIVDNDQVEALARYVSSPPRGHG